MRLLNALAVERAQARSWDPDDAAQAAGGCSTKYCSLNVA